MPPLPVLVDTLRDLPVWASLGLLVIASLLGAYVVARITLWVVTRLTPATSTAIDDVVLTELRPPLVGTVGVAGVYAAEQWLDLATADGSYLVAGASTLLIVLWGRAFIRVGRGSIATLDRDSGAMDVAPILENLWSFTVIVVALFALLTVWNVDVTPLLASAGIAGIALGFAARDTVANFFGSIALHVDDTYRVGDFIVLDSGVSGTVIDVSVRSTRILTRDDVVVTVPNAVLNATQVTNRSQPRTRTRVKVPVGVAFGSDLDLVESVLLEAAAAQDRIVETPPPRARFRGFGESAIEYELLAWIDSPHQEGRATHDLNRAVYTGFADAGIEIPFPRHDVRLVGTDGVDDGAGSLAGDDGSVAVDGEDAPDPTQGTG